jgi:aminoglycoside N3'-acetyltransferase
MVGLISELFRRLPGTTRSEQYWLPVCGQGRLAEELLTDQARVVHPFGPGSTFDRMRGRGGKHLGLGVTLNTSTLSHLADFDLESHGIRTFWPKPLEGQIRNHSGETVHVATIVVKPEVRASYRPTRLFEASKLLDESVRRRDAGCAVRVSYSLDLYHSEAVRIGRERLQLGLLPPWLEEIEPVHLR